MKSSSPGALTCGFAGLPVSDEDLVGVFSAFGGGGFGVASLLVVVCGAGLAVVAAPGRCACGESEFGANAGDKARTGEGGLLVFGGQVPGKDGHIAGGGANGGLE